MNVGVLFSAKTIREGSVTCIDFVAVGVPAKVIRKWA